MGILSMFGASRPLKMGLIGLGKIAIDQHIPSIRANKQLSLIAGCSPHARPDGIHAYNDMHEMLSAHPEIEAIAICTPPQIRHEIAKDVIRGGRHVFLEKPPAATLGEAEAIKAMAAEKGVSLLASWHSRFAPAVEAARTWMAARPLKRVSIVWKENVRQWHPGQKWIFEAGGMGVFDPGINSLSILTRIVPEAVLPIRAEYDFLQTGLQTWSIYVESQAGEKMSLSLGGTEMEVDGKVVVQAKEAEYPGLYAHFVELVRTKTSDADFSPLRIVSDAMLLGKRIAAPEYIE